MTAQGSRRGKSSLLGDLRQAHFLLSRLPAGGQRPSLTTRSMTVAGGPETTAYPGRGLWDGPLDTPPCPSGPNLGLTRKSQQPLGCLPAATPAQECISSPTCWWAHTCSAPTLPVQAVLGVLGSPIRFSRKLFLELSQVQLPLPLKHHAGPVLSPLLHLSHLSSRASGPLHMPPPTLFVFVPRLA